ncbi:MAG: hypothetical protein KME31_14595 [Tolypothrix carrinoi HA7290-LM1]|nr:hypothetical protein [Tolypothrix carrinoi HA7290-LM1]
MVGKGEDWAAIERGMLSDLEDLSNQMKLRNERGDSALDGTERVIGALSKFGTLPQPASGNWFSDWLTDWRVQSPIINRLRQDLAWQLREIAHVNSLRSIDGDVPLLWGWLCGERESKRYDALRDRSIGLGITSTVRPDRPPYL